MTRVDAFKSLNTYKYMTRVDAFKSLNTYKYIYDEGRCTVNWVSGGSLSTFALCLLLIEPTER